MPVECAASEEFKPMDRLFARCLGAVAIVFVVATPATTTAGTSTIATSPAPAGRPAGRTPDQASRGPRRDDGDLQGARRGRGCVGSGEGRMDRDGRTCRP